MMKRRIDSLEKQIKRAGFGTCLACYSTDRRFGWVPMVIPPAKANGGSMPYDAAGRCIRCGAEPRETVTIVTSALPGSAGGG